MTCGILVPRPGIEPTPRAVEGRVLTTGPLPTSCFKSSFKHELSYFHPKAMTLVTLQGSKGFSLTYTVTVLKK